MKKTLKLALFGAVFGAMVPASMAANAPDCVKIAKVVNSAVAAEPAKVLELVEAYVAANESCACEVVRAAINASKADKKNVAAIVRVASGAAPDQLRLIAQCAVAVAPDALTEVQSVLAELDANKGDSVVVQGDYEKGGTPKGGVVPGPIADNNPLDFPTGPGGVVVGPPAGAAPRAPLPSGSTFASSTQVFVPPVVEDDDVTDLEYYEHTLPLLSVDTGASN